MVPPPPPKNHIIAIVAIKHTQRGKPGEGWRPQMGLADRYFFRGVGLG